MTKKKSKKDPKPPAWQPSDTSCQPPAGKTYLTIGQDFFSIEEYLLSQYNASLEGNNIRPLASFEPAATMFYTDIQELRGLSTPVDYGSGIEYAGALAEAFPESGIQIGLWLNGTSGCQDIVNGVLDAQIQELYVQLEKLHVPKVFLRVGYEFDNPWFGYSGDPLVYQQAFQYMVQVCETQLSIPGCHRVISFVWHSWAAPKEAPLQDFYPGDEFVDWIGISIFQQLYPWANNAQNGDFAGGTLDQVQEVLEFAKSHNKRVMIAESTPFGGMQFENQPPPEVNYNATTTMDIWDLWFQPTLDLIEEYDIGMWSYINCDWNSQPMWAGVGFGDTRISSDENVMAKWRQFVLANPRFLTKMDCWSTIYEQYKTHYKQLYAPPPPPAEKGPTIHEQYKNHYKQLYAPPLPPAEKGPLTTGTTNASLYNVESFSMMLPALVAVGIIYMIFSTLHNLYCKLRVDEEPTNITKEETKEILKKEPKTLYGSVSNVSSSEGNSNSSGSRWSVNL